MDTRTVGDMMVPIDEYPQISESLSLYEAMKIIRNCQITNPAGTLSSPRVLLVFNRDLQIVGIVRRRDILRGLEPGYLVRSKVKHQRTAFDVMMDANLSELSWDTMAGGMRTRSRRPVREVMSPIVATINHDDHLMKAVNQLVECNTSIIPVLNEGKVVGVLRTIDVLHEIEAMLDAPTENNTPRNARDTDVSGEE